MGSVNEEITRIAGAKVAIEGAIEECGVNVPAGDRIDTYAEHIRAIPAAVFSQFTVDEAGGDDKYIKSISQTNGVISAAEGGLASSESSGLMSAADKAKLDGIEAGAKKNVQSDWIVSDTTSDAYISNKPANLSDFNNDLSSLKIGTKSYDGSEEVTISKADLGLSNVLIYKGESSVEIVDGENMQAVINGSTLEAQPGNVVFYGNCEFVWNGSKWEKLGDDVTYKVIQDAVVDPNPDGSGLTFISNIEQNANGVISPTKKTVQNATASQAGIVTTGEQTFAGNKTFNGAMTVNNTITFGELDSYGLRTSKDNYVTIGESNYSFYQSYINFMYTNNIRVNGNAGTIGQSNNRFTYGYFSKAVYAATGFYESSDETLKTILKPLEVNLNDLAKLRKIYYLWKDSSDNHTQLGMIAQDIQKVYPELVDVDQENGLLSLAYDKLSVVALSAIDKLHEEVKALKSKNQELENRISKLENLLLHGKEQ